MSAGKKFTKEEASEALIALHKKLGRIPEMPDCESIGLRERQIRNNFGTLSRALSECGILRDDEPDLKKEGELRLKIAQLKQTNKRLESSIKELQEEALSAKNLREIIHGHADAELGKSPSWLSEVKNPKETTGIPVLFLSDIHFDEVVKPEQIGFVNEYNREIASQRIKHTFASAVMLLKGHFKNPKYDGIVCALGGDLLSGNIHEELAETNEASINVSILQLTDLLISGLELIASEFKQVFVPCVVGNHGRQHKKPRAKNRVHENYEWLIYEYLRRHFKDDKRFTFLIPDGPDAQFNIYGKNFLLTHGDQFRGGTGIAGLFSPLMLGMARKQSRNNAFKKPFDIMMIGHWHTYVHTNNLIVNGSIKGLDEYAYQGNFGAEPPQQALFVMHPQYGCTFRMPIYCDPAQSFSGEKKIEAIW